METTAMAEKKKSNNVIKVFFGFFILFVSVIFVVSLTGTQHNIAWYKEAFVTVLWLAAIAALFFIFRSWEAWFVRYERTVLLAVCVFWGISLYVFSCLIRSEPWTEYLSVWNSAFGLATGGNVNWQYFAIWKNNFFLMLFLAGLIVLSNLLNMADPFYLILFVAVLSILWAGVCIYRILRLAGQPIFVCFFALFLFVGFVPCWGGTQYFYTDTMSLCFGVWSAYILFSSLKKDLKAARLICAGVIGGIGFALKATSAIALIAMVLAVLIVIRRKITRLLKLTVCTAAGGLAAIILVQLIWIQSPCYEMEYTYGAPLEYWIALGSVANGGYGENAQFALECINVPGKDAKRQLAWEYIASHREELWSVTRLLSKMRNNYASGNMGLSEFINSSDSAAYEFLNDYGKYGGYMTMLTTGYFYALLLYGIMGSLLIIREESGLGSDKDLRLLSEVLTGLAVLGIFLFLMIWEANNRQLYNHIPWFALMGAQGGSRVLGRISIKSKMAAVSKAD